MLHCIYNAHEDNYNHCVTTIAAIFHVSQRELLFGNKKLTIVSSFPQAGETATTYHFKTMVPSVAAGAIIGKGGETIASLQKDAGARVKMSKSHDFYPGECRLMNL